MFKRNPHFIITLNGIFPVEYAIAFGGVPTGSIKANDAVIAITINNGSTEMDNCFAIEIPTGEIIEVKAIFEVNSVEKFTKKPNSNVITGSETVPTLAISNFVQTSIVPV